MQNRNSQIVKRPFAHPEYNSIAFANSVIKFHVLNIQKDTFVRRQRAHCALYNMFVTYLGWSKIKKTDYQYIIFDAYMVLPRSVTF